jgi:PAS domain S-box-containing protein
METDQKPEWLKSQLQPTLNMIPAYTWYAAPSGALRFVNERAADYGGLPKDHPLRTGEGAGEEWDLHITFLHPDDRDETRRVWANSLRTGRASEVSFRVRGADGGYRWFLSRAEPVRDANGAVLCWIGVNLDIEERKQAEFYLAEGQRLAHTGSWALTSAGFESWSSEMFQIHGLDPMSKAPTIEEYLAMIHPEDREFVAQQIQEIFEIHRAFDVTKRIVRPDGSIRHVRCVGVPATSGEIFQGFVGTGIDVTEQEQLTQELQRREIELRRSKSHLADAQRLSRTGSVGMEVSTKRIFWSEEAARIYGYPPGTEPTPDLILQRSHPDDVDLVQDAIDRVSRGGNDFDYEHRLLMPDGSIKHLHDLAHRVRDEAGNEEVVGAIMDVTERKIAEEAIRRSEAYLAEGQRLSHTGSFGWKPATGEIVWSDETYRIFEYDRARKPTLDVAFQRIHPDDRDLAQQLVERVSTSGEDFEHECRLVMPGGAIKHLHVRAHSLHHSRGNIEFVGAVIDITDRKAAEERIREQDAELQQILDLTPQLIAVYGPSRERIYVNRTGLDYLGLTLEEWLQTPVQFAFIHPDDRDRERTYFASVRSAGSSDQLELRLRRGDGSYRWFLARYNSVRDDTGQILRWYVSCTDIEDRKRAEERLHQENVALREEIDKASMFEEIVGGSPGLTAVLSRVSKVASTDSTVLITGETGTGKELVARAIHRRSRRASRAFVAVNCAAIPRDLIPSELFGHEKGAFTGAVQRRLGRFELAEGGTIFLDEVGELSSETQIALLRVLQEREFERVGGRERIKVDVRVIAATNRDLTAAVAEGTFRQDLFYRLNVFPIEVPPLRDRTEDIPMLVEHFIGRYARKAGKAFRSVGKRTLDHLQSYPWPGNIRELQNVIERSVIVSDTDEFVVDESWLSAAPQVGSQSGLSSALATHEKAIIEDALRACGGRVFGPSGAAARLGIPRSTLESKIRALKIKKSRFRTQTAKRS